VNTAPPRPGSGTDPLGVVAGTAAQEIGSALTAIQVATERLERARPSAEGPGALEFRVIREQSERLARLARQLLELSRPPEHAEAPRAPIDLSAFLVRMLPALRRELDEVGVGMQLEGTLSATGCIGPHVRAEPLGLRDVVLALVANARTAALGAPGPRWVRIGVHALEGGSGEVAVGDSGPGVPEGADERIFLPFVSGWGGAGMGLSRSRKALAAAGGALAVRRHPGGGSEFVLTLEPYSRDT
jgi:signal transduction histidine kinase